VPLTRSSCPAHLHERKQPLLQPGPTAGSDSDHRKATRCRPVERPADFLASRCTHGAAELAEPRFNEDHHAASDVSNPGHDGFAIRLAEERPIAWKTQGVAAAEPTVPFCQQRKRSGRHLQA
jgi:hypothetical protein